MAPFIGTVHSVECDENTDPEADHISLLGKTTVAIINPNRKKRNHT